jgi:uncharacterized membrane protein YdjX (TVP38/TMEM64 family)
VFVLVPLGLFVVLINLGTTDHWFQLPSKVRLGVTIAFGAVLLAWLCNRIVVTGRASRLGFAGPMAVGALFLPPLGSIALFMTMGTTGPWLQSHASIGVLIYVTAFAILAGLALLPTYAQSALGGFAFGVTLGIPAALCGFVGGALIGYTIAGRAAGDRVDRLIDEKPKWRAVRDALLDRRRGWLGTTGMVALLRLPPNSPFALMNLVMASVKVPRSCFLVGTLLGMLPRSSLAVVIGAGVEKLTKESLDAAVPGWVWWTGIALTVTIVGVIGYIANSAIERITRAQAGAGDTLAP